VYAFNFQANPNASKMLQSLPFALAFGCFKNELVTLLFGFGANSRIRGCSNSYTVLDDVATITGPTNNFIPILTNPPPPTKVKTKFKIHSEVEECSCIAQPSVHCRWFHEM
jgi:hypothetical protein